MPGRKILTVLVSLAFFSCTTDNKMTQEQTPQISRKDFLLGRFDPLKHPDFVMIDQKYADREGMTMQREAYNAFLKLTEAGERAGYSFCILSATRNFFYQKYLWENKWYGIFPVHGNIDACTSYTDEVRRAEKIMEFSAMPGTSRHHWGTDIDINALENDYFESGDGLAWYQWMTQNAATYGFCQPYTAGRNHGYQEEKWHWTYLPLSKHYTNEIRNIITDDMIDGFAGSEHSHRLEIVDHYILGINEACK